MSRRIFKPVAMLGMLLLLLMAAAPALAYHDDPGEDHDFADPAFQRTWERTDKFVAESGETAPRTWIWGPEPYTDGRMEPYADSPGEERLVQYFDKSRMELNCPVDEAVCDDIDEDSPWYVTNGLLVVEMVEGHYQTGDAEFDQSPDPANVNIAGDPGERPTYADINEFDLRNEPAAANGAILNQRLNDDGTITPDPSKNDANITAAFRVQEPGIDHQVASVFWQFMNSTGTVWEDGQYITDNLFENAFYATGLPITEGYWSTVEVNETERDVFWQCFERRCLTYTPGNPAGFLVEAGNVGQHYYRWRYGDPEPPRDVFLYHAELNGENERPAPVDTDATGHAWFFLDGETLRFHIDVENIENASAAHIHTGGADATGGVIVPLFTTADESEWFSGSGEFAEGTITADMLPGSTTWDELLDAMETGGVYVNVHTDQNEAGEIRGQIVTADDIEFETELSGDNEDPPVTSDATGTATFTFDHDTDSVAYSLSVMDIENVFAAHIHLGPEDGSGPVVAPLFMADPPVDPADGVLETGTLLHDDLVNDLEGERIERLVWEMVTHRTYVNVHTTQNQSGEIRGQIRLAIEDEPDPEVTSYVVLLGGLNESGVDGSAMLEAGPGGSWDLTMDLAGLEAGSHPWHIHGFDDDSVAHCPTDAQAGDDGIVTLQEGLPAYGPPVFSFADLVVGDDGIAEVDNLNIIHDFSSTPLVNNVLVIHGMTTEVDQDGDGMTNEYEPLLPVACGLIVPVSPDGFVASLDGESVEPTPVTTDTTGFFVARLNPDASILSWMIHFEDAEPINDTRIFDNSTGNEGDTLLVLHSFHSVEPFSGTGIFWSGLKSEGDIPGDLDLAGLAELMRSGDTYVQAGESDGMDGYDPLVRGDIVTMETWVMP